MKNRVVPLLCWALSTGAGRAETAAPNPGNGWPAVDGLGRKVEPVVARSPSKPRQVALFYWTWHDQHAQHTGPWNVTDILLKSPDAAGHPNHPAWGPYHAPHFWGEPLFGYYRSSDRWVLARHARLLAEAGVDAIVFDCTNGSFTWKEAYLPLLEVFAAARTNGIAAPAVAFMLGFGPSADACRALEDVYDTLYKPGRFRELWFSWQGKPLIMAYPECLQFSRRPAEDVEALRRFFAFRPGQPLYRGGPTRSDHWGWLEISPQNGYGRKTDGTFEQVTVGVAQNWADPRGLSAMNAPNARGRSFTVRPDVSPTVPSSLAGLNFQEQWDRAVELDPDLVFVTGWNEWVAGRFPEWMGTSNAFPDQYDAEHSRDIEPGRGTLQDHYYYQFVDNIRHYKGSAGRAVARIAHTCVMDGKFADWDAVREEYSDPVATVPGRDSDGYRGTHYTARAPRNDIVRSRVCDDETNIYFHVRTAGPLSPSSEPDWMRLLIQVDADATNGWNGFEWAVDWIGGRPRLGKLNSAGRLEAGDFVSGAIGERDIELAIPRSRLGLGEKFRIGFKWMDAFPLAKPYYEALAEGESAPMGRFFYLYGP